MSNDRATCWSVTINNPTKEDRECISVARQKGWRIEGQIESGTENGTIHYQMMVRTPQVRFSAMKKAFPRAHIEPARNPQALAQYVAKEDTAVAPLPVQSDRYPSLSKFWDFCLEILNDESKDGLDYIALREENRIKFYRDEDQRRFLDDPLITLDRIGHILITRGYFVEGIVCNPNVRSAWKRFAVPILLRSFNHRETDRQTDSVQNAEVPFEHQDIPNGSNETQDSDSQCSREETYASVREGETLDP